MKKKILVIDDKKDNLISITALLRNYLPDCETLIAESGAEGIEIAKREKPDVILLDIIMPKMDGYEVCKRLKEDESTKHVPIVMITAIRTDFESRIKGLEIGADAFLAKPIEPSELSAQINVMFRIKEAEDKLRAEKEGLEEKVLERTNELVIANTDLKYSEERLRILFESAPDAYFLSDITGIFIDGNKAAENLVGYKKGELIGKNYLKLKLLPAKEMLKASKLLLKNVQGKSTGPDEFILNNKNGSQVTVEILTHPVKMKNKTVVLGIARDITKRKKVQDKLINSENRFKQITDNSQEWIWEVDSNGLYTYSSEIGEKILGFKNDEIVGKKHFYDLFIKEEREEFKNVALGMFKQKLPFREFINRNVTKNGEIVWLSTSGVPMLDNNANLIGYRGSDTNITERKQSEINLQDSEEKFRSLINNSPDIIMRIDAEGTINFINYGYSNQKPEDIIGQTIYKFMPVEFHNIARETIKKVFETGNSYSFENLGVGNDSNVLWYRNNIAAISKNGKVVAATIIVTDISKLKQTDILQKEFIASVSHELRTPLTIIRESLSMLSEGILGSLNKDQMDIVNPCMDDVDRLARILNNLLSISSIEEQKINLNQEMVDFVKLAKGAVSSFKNQAASKNIDLIFNTNRESINLYLDQDRMIQVFMNLIGNAIKFTEKGKIAVNITENEEKVVCCIEDTGRGIDQKDLGTIFDRFHQVGKIMRAGEQGSGLGLSISKGIVKLHKGKIWVNSKLNKGSKFFFSFPNNDPEKIILEQIENEIKTITGKRLKRTLLLINLNNYSKIESKFGVGKAWKVTELIFQKIQNELAPGEFSFIKEKNEVILFSEITKPNINILIAKLEDSLAEPLQKIDKNLKVNLSYGCSSFTDKGESASELMQNAFNELIKHQLE